MTISTQSYWPRLSSGVTLHLQVVLAAAANEGKVRVVIADHGTLFLQQLDDGESGRLAQVVNISLIGNAQHQAPSIR